MRVFHFCEQPYPPAWRPEISLRVNLPSRECDPATAADLYARYLDEWLLADELGLDIMVNEHHSTATCMSVSAHVTLGILARQTRRARLLSLGSPIGNRPDPLRVAEELAMVDVISRGRLEMGMVKGVPYEVVPANANPVWLMDRFWEAHDFILKAMTSHDGPFSWEGQFFHYRSVNVWPRPFQQPHPPVWITTSSLGNARKIAARGHVMATFMTGYKAKGLFDAYREAWLAQGRAGPVPLDRFGYLALAAVADTEEEAHRRAEQVAGYLRTTAQVAPQFANPPGYVSVADNARLLRARLSGVTPAASIQTRDGRPISPRTATIPDLIDAGLVFAGTPDQVYDQINGFCDAVGGISNMLLMMQGGWLSHDDTAASLTLFAREVLPRLKEYRREALTMV